MYKTINRSKPCGSSLDFAYAIAIPQAEGKIVSASVEATIAGATGTYMDNKSYYTNSSGVDVGIAVGDPSVTIAGNTMVTLNKDTMASTLRYFYIIPEEARGNSVSFTFLAIASNGHTVTYTMGPYTVAKMDMKLDLILSHNNNNYLSITDMEVYNSVNAAANADKIDLVYLHRTLATTPITYAHDLMSPAADPIYLSGIALPTGVNKSTLMNKVWSLRDRHLARIQFGVYIDDIDFQQISFSGSPNFAINLRAEAGVWVETADGKYRAYIYANSINNTAKTMTVSIKRYTMN